jgi:hypothetical protein
MDDFIENSKVIEPDVEELENKSIKIQCSGVYDNQCSN